jgi:hypothetical protein
LVWLVSCDKHRNEEIKQAAATGPDLNTPQSRDEEKCVRFRPRPVRLFESLRRPDLRSS